MCAPTTSIHEGQGRQVWHEQSRGQLSLRSACMWVHSVAKSSPSGDAAVVCRLIDIFSDRNSQPPPVRYGLQHTPPQTRPRGGVCSPCPSFVRLDPASVTRWRDPATWWQNKADPGRYPPYTQRSLGFVGLVL